MNSLKTLVAGFSILALVGSVSFADEHPTNTTETPAATETHPGTTGEHPATEATATTEKHHKVAKKTKKAQKKDHKKGTTEGTAEEAPAQ